MKRTTAFAIVACLILVMSLVGCPAPSGDGGGTPAKYTFESTTNIATWITNGDIYAGVDWGGWGTANVISTSTTYANGGTQSLKSVATLDGAGNDQIQIGFKMLETLGGNQDLQGKTITVHVYVPVGDPSAQFDFYQLAIEDANGNNYPQLIGTITPGSWRTLTYTCPASNNQFDAVTTIYLMAMRGAGSPGAGTATLYFDDFGW